MGADSLEALVCYYQNTGLGLGEILKTLSLRIYNYPLRRFRGNEDDCGEFYLFFYPRLLRTLERYRPQGKPFEWYLNSVLRWHYRDYCTRRRRSEQNWALSQEAAIWEDPGRPEPHPPFVAMGAAMDARFDPARAAHRKRLLFLALKGVRDLNDSDLPRIGALTGLGEERLTALVERLRLELHTRELRFHQLYMRRNRGFYRLLLLERELSRESDPDRRAELALQVAGQRDRLATLQRKIKRVRLHPSNRQIAELLGVPKGTVDTALFWLRKRLQPPSGVSEANAAPRLCA